MKAGDHDAKSLRELYPEVCAKCPRYVEQYLRDQQEEPEIESHPLREWQQELVEILKTPPDPRHVIFVVDQKGNAGKSWFAKYYNQVYGESLRLTPCRKVDMIYGIYSSLKQYKVFFIDIARSRMDNEGNKLFPYELMEELKNGELFNSKYSSETFRFPVPHVVCMTNEEPNMTMLSSDRYKFIRTS